MEVRSGKLRSSLEVLIQQDSAAKNPSAKTLVSSTAQLNHAARRLFTRQVLTSKVPKEIHNIRLVYRRLATIGIRFLLKTLVFSPESLLRNIRLLQFVIDHPDYPRYVQAVFYNVAHNPFGPFETQHGRRSKECKAYKAYRKRRAKLSNDNSGISWLQNSFAKTSNLRQLVIKNEGSLSCA
ncbi:hypothetical protein OQA88_10749 [Cercophora sp. LCS_1]